MFIPKCSHSQTPTCWLLRLSLGRFLIHFVVFFLRFFVFGGIFFFFFLAWPIFSPPCYIAKRWNPGHALASSLAEIRLQERHLYMWYGALGDRWCWATDSSVVSRRWDQRQKPLWSHWEGSGGQGSRGRRGLPCPGLFTSVAESWLASGSLNTPRDMELSYRSQQLLHENILRV